MTALAACDLPFNLGQPTTRALESGAESSLNSATSFELSGSYVDSGVGWTVDLQFVRPSTQHMLVSQGSTQIEAIVIDGTAYFRGRDFLSKHLGTASAAHTLANAAGNAWWTGTASSLPNLSDFTDGSRLRSTFMGSAVTQRIDHVSVDGADAVDLSGPRADVYIAAAPPYQLLRLRLKPHAVIDGISAGDLHFSNFGRDFGIVAPTDVIDFSNLSTLPPLYTVISVDTSSCASPCVVSAVVKNLGGKKGAKAPSSVTFTLTNSASGAVLGACKVPIQPDVDYNVTTTVSCSISGSPGQGYNAGIVTATPENPGRA